MVGKLVIMVVVGLLFLQVASAIDISSDDFETGGFSGGTGWIAPWNIIGSCVVTSLQNPIGQYQLRGDSCDARRTVDLSSYQNVVVSFYGAASSLEGSEACQYYYSDGITETNIVTIPNGQDDGVLRYYSYNVTTAGANAYLRMSIGSGADYCQMDNVVITGDLITPELKLYSSLQYQKATTVTLDMTSSVVNTEHNLKVYLSNGTLICDKYVISPSVKGTVFQTTCSLPDVLDTNAYMILSTIGANVTKTFNIVDLQRNTDKLRIDRVYYSPQVLQGGSTEVFAIIEADGNINSVSLELTYPDMTTRTLGMYPTTNAGEYRAFITDTYRTGATFFNIKAVSGVYYDTYLNSYYVVPFSVDYVANVGNVSSVNTVDSVNELHISKMDVFGTEYDNSQSVKVWLQLLNETGDYVNDGVCYVDIYSPDNEEYLEYARMDAMNHDGVYYYDTPSPLVEGVYPVIARCFYEAEEFEYYVTSYNMTIANGYTTFVSDNFETGTFTGGSGWNNIWSYTDSKITLVAGIGSLYRARVQSSNRVLERRFNNLDYSEGTVYLNFTTASTLGGAVDCQYQYWNGVNYTTLLTLTTTTTSTARSYNISAYGVSSSAGIRLLSGSTNSNNDYCYLDNVTVSGLIKSPNISNIDVVDNQYTVFQEKQSVGISRFDVTFNFNDTQDCANLDPQLLTTLTVDLHGKIDSVPNDDITVSIWNYTNSSWIVLPNKLLEGNLFVSASNSISTSNITDDGLYSPSTGIKVRLTDSSFSDTVNNFIYIDKLTVSCEQLANPQWQEVKGSSEIHISAKSEGLYNYKFYVQTLCGSETETFSTSSACAIFEHNESYWNYTWGYIHGEIDILNNYQTNVDSFFFYETQLGQDCTALLDVYSTDLDTNVTTDIIDDIQLSAGTKENCVIRIPVHFTPEERGVHIEINQDNYMSWEIQRAADYLRYFDLAITPFCEMIATENNLPYTIPIYGNIDVSLLYANNPIFLGCYRVIDDLYWMEYYYNTSLGSLTTGEMESYLLEIRFYYPEVKDHAFIIQQLSQNEKELMITPYTLCGQNHKDYSCSLTLPPDDYFSSEEGYIKENVTIYNNFNTNIITNYVYETAGDVDCTAILDVIRYSVNGNSSLYNITNYALGAKDNCELTIPINLTANETSINIVILQENYIHWNMWQMTDKIHAVEDRITNYCDEVALDNNITYNIPINSSLNQTLISGELLFCYRAMDDLYWWNYYSNGHELTHGEIETVGGLEGYYSEYKYFYPFIMFDSEVVSRRITESAATQGVTFIGGTEYSSGEEGKVSIRIVKSNGDPLTGATCSASILYPNMTSFVNGVAMSEYSDGIYYYDYIVPTTEGIYIYYTDCNESGKDYRAMNTFHVSPWANIIGSLETMLDEINGSITLTPELVWNYTNRTLSATEKSWIGGTEYSASETEGKVVVRMTDQAGVPVTGGTCVMTVFFNASIIINQTPMTEYIGTPEGVYYVTFNLTGIGGVYPYTVDCLKSGKNYYLLGSYHIFDNSYTTNLLEEINQTTHDIYDILIDVQNILDEINYTINNLQVTAIVDFTNVTNNITSIQNDIFDLREVVDESSDFSQEAIFLVTDSLVAVDKARTADTTVEKIDHLEEAMDKLVAFQTYKEPQDNGIYYIVGLVMIGVIGSVGIVRKITRKRGGHEDEKGVSVDGADGHAREHGISE